MLILKILNSDILMQNTVFLGQNSLNMSTARAIYMECSTLTMVHCHFERITGCDGGAICALAASNLSLDDAVFIANEAMGPAGRGGAIFSQDSTLVIIDSSFINNSAKSNGSRPESYGGAIYAERSHINLQNNFFSKNSASSGGAVFAESSLFGISSSALFHGNRATEKGGAVYLQNVSAMVSGNAINFTKNSANRSGGGMAISQSQVQVLALATFIGNVAGFDGGAISARNSRLDLGGTSNFTCNTARQGGAIAIYGRSDFSDRSSFSISGSALLSSNVAPWSGGAVHLRFTNATLSGNGTIKFINNSAKQGGGICIKDSQILATAIFVDNTAEDGGGISSTSDQQVTLLSATFTNNKASECGGAVHIKQTTNTIYFKSINAVRNSGSALCILKGKVAFSGYTAISDNTGRLGGGMVIYSSNLVSFTNYSLFTRNRAFTGGAIYTFVGVTLTFHGLTRFEKNMAETNGGAVCALASNITFWSPAGVLGANSITFTKNSADNGGAIFVDSSSSLTIHSPAVLSTSHNHARKHGGAIYHEDSATPIQCNYEENEDETEINKLPYCFMNFDAYSMIQGPDCEICLYRVRSYNDSSQKDGDFIYGGLLDRCQSYQPATSLRQVVLYTWVKEHFRANKEHAITSQPYQLCFCDGDEYDCSGVRSILTHRGKKFTLSLIALDQLRAATSTQINTKTLQTGRLGLNQAIQTLRSMNCLNLSYAIYSVADFEELTLYPDGPCQDTGLAKAVVSVTLLPCPDGFIQFNEECICEKILQEHNAACIIDEDILIVRKAGAKFWIDASYANSSYQGLILYETCPVGYCKVETLHLTLDSPDMQCADNRGGTLCGACANNYSLMLGSSRCGECSNFYLGLLLLFAATGILLVIFLSVLRLTVASGIANSVVLYANIVQVNKSLFLPAHKVNFLTVFIAWINLDLGIETCLYDGMTAYAQVWLQFVFPIYVWMLMSLIVIASRYSVTISKLIGHDPIAVLATLLLMSYTKILKMFVDVYSYASLSYPHHRTMVWLKDGILFYLQSWHLFLTVVTSIVLVFLFLPYTILLLTGYKLYYISQSKYLHWLYKLKPFLDSYYAPFKKNTRFWTGFLLLIRCALYFAFSFHQQTVSTLALIITFTALILFGWSLKWVYERPHIIVMEFSIYFNIVALSVATLVHINSPSFVYSLIGIVFVTTVCIVAYNFHIFYTSKSSVWLKIVRKFLSLKKRPNSSQPVGIPASSNHHKIVTKTIISLREPLLEN